VIELILKNETQLKILREIWLKKKTTMSEISNNLQIDRSNVSRNLKNLRSIGLVYYSDNKIKNNNRGRKTLQLQINYTFAYNIGIAVTENFFLVLLMDLNFNVIRKETIFKEVNEKTIVDDLINCIEIFSDFLEQVLFIAISFPEPVDDEKGLILSSGIFPIKDMYLKNILEERINIPVHLENDANAGAIYHYYKNNGIYRFINFMFLSFYVNKKSINGIQGNGIIINGEIYKGAHSFAGEVPVIIPIWKQNEKDYMDILKFQQYIKDEKKSHILKDYIDIYSKAASIIINFLDPEIFIFGGHTEILPQFSLKSMVSKTKEKIIDNERRKIKMDIDNDGLESIAKGSAMSFMNKIMNNYNMANKVFLKLNKPTFSNF
jgi:DNA-binding transcriptional ArsR family regulator